MIIAITDPGKSRAASGLADTLASLRSSHGRKVLLIDADARRLSRFCAEGQQYRQYQDVVIDTEGYDTLASRAALIAAQVVLVPINVEQADLARQYKLVASLNSARMFNPGLRVKFVLSAEPAPGSEELRTIRNYVAHVMSATLAGAPLHDADALCREVFQG